MLPEIMSVAQVANYLGVHRNTIYNWISAECLPSFKAGNTIRIRKEELMRWMTQKAQIEDL